MTDEEREIRARLYRVVDNIQTRVQHYVDTGWDAEQALIRAALDCGARVTRLEE